MSRHYRVCAYCGKREYGENVRRLMTLAPDGKHFRSEAHFMHKMCPCDFVFSNEHKAKFPCQRPRGHQGAHSLHAHKEDRV